MRARRRQLQGELARALAVLGINGAQFHGLASRKKIDEVKFIYSEKATKFCEILTLHLTTVHRVKSKVKISQNFVAFAEYMNFTFKGGKISNSIFVSPTATHVSPPFFHNIEQDYWLPNVLKPNHFKKQCSTSLFLLFYPIIQV